MLHAARSHRRDVIRCDIVNAHGNQLVGIGMLVAEALQLLDHQLAARELLKLDVTNTYLVIEHEYPKALIQDNGHGFDAVKPGGGKGMTTMRMRAEKLGGRIEHLSAPEAGTSVTVILHMPE